MSEGYSYTTISAHPGEPVRVGVSFYLDSRNWIAVAGAGTDRPHLAIKAGDVSAAIGPADPGEITAEDARLARVLADQAALYATEIERLALASEPGEPGSTAA
jgi:hypothetical protein